MTAEVFVDTNVLLASAKQMGCHTVYSEDMNAGQNYDGVTVVNPFATLTP